MDFELKEGSIIEGTVTKIKPFGALVQLPGNIQGLVHISHISASYVQNVEEFVSVGDTVSVKVLSVDLKANKVALSIKEASKEAEVPRHDTQASHRSDYNQVSHPGAPSSFEEKFKEYVKASNERLASLNKRNKKR